MSKMINNYPRNCWWVAATSREVCNSPIARWLLDEPVVLYRTPDGKAVVLEDRCPHRWAPLSEGRMVDERLICRYHGAQFGPDGVCVKVPSQDFVPPQARVKSYPLVEQNGYLWIWMGDVDAAQIAPPPVLEFSVAPGWDNLSGFMTVDCNYFLIQENVLDLTHFSFLHADTLEQEGWEMGHSEVVMNEKEVTYRKDVIDAPIAPFIGLPIGATPAETCNRLDWGSFVLPSTHVAGIDFQYKDKKAHDGSAALKFRVSHLTTPESSNRTHYWWVVSFNYGRSDQAVGATITEILELTFAQDKAILERIQHRIDRDRPEKEPLEVSFVADRPALRARRVLAAMLAAEGR